MSRGRPWWMLGLCCWLATLPAQATEPDRQQIVAARQAIQRDFATQELACQKRFAVTDCVEDVRLRRRQALAPWREKELALDAADRRRRASERQAAIKSKVQAAAAEAASAPPVLPRERKAMAAPSATLPAAPPAADPARAARRGSPRAGSQPAQGRGQSSTGACGSPSGGTGGESQGGQGGGAVAGAGQWCRFWRALSALRRASVKTRSAHRVQCGPAPATGCRHRRGPAGAPC
jgi:hypothetical protein